METVNYSIIIPHHNTPKLLQKCVESIPERDDIQVIVIDDNSDPNIVDFDKPLVNNRNNVEVVYNKNGKGAGHARNIGLDNAKGKWLLFVDSDDYILPDSFTFFDKYLETDADIVYFGVDSVYADTGEKADRQNGVDSLLHQTIQETSDHNHIRIRLKHVVPWGKMIRKSIVDDNKIRFDEVWYSNDVMFSVQVGWAANKILIDLSKVYVVTVSKGSLTNRKNINNYMSRYEVCLRHNCFVRNIGMPQYQMSIMYYYINIAKYGVKFWWKATRLMLKYKNNPFIGMDNWARTILKMRKQDKRREKYRTC